MTFRTLCLSALIPFVLVLVACEPINNPEACEKEGMFCQPIREVVCEKQVWYGGIEGESRSWELETVDIPCPTE